MKQQIKELFSEINYKVEEKHGDWATLMGEVVIAGLVITIIAGIALANSIWGIIIAGILILILIAAFKNPTF